MSHADTEDMHDDKGAPHELETYYFRYVLIILFSISLVSSLFALYADPSLLVLNSPVKFLNLLVGGLISLYLVQRYSYLNWSHVFKTHWATLLYICMVMFINLFIIGIPGAIGSAAGYFLSILIYFVAVPLFLVATATFGLALSVAIGFGVFTTVFVYLTALGMRSFLGLPLNAAYEGILPIFVSGGGGLIGDHIPYGGFCALCTIASIYLYRTTRKMIYAVAGCFIASGVVIAQSRGAVLGLALAIGMMFLPQKAKTNFNYLVIGGIATLAVGGGLMVLVLMVPELATYFRVDSGASAREYAWLLAALAIIRHPWFGYGSGQSVLVYAAMGGDILQQYGVPGGTVNNTFLTSSVDNGIPATVVYVFVLFYALKLSVSNTLQAPLRDFFIMVCFATMFMMIFQDMNLGGVRLNSMLMTLSIGSIYAVNTIRKTLKVDSGLGHMGPVYQAPIS